MKKTIALLNTLLIICVLKAQTIENRNICGTVYTPGYFDTISTDWRSTNQNKINDFNWTNQSLNNRTFSSTSTPIIINTTNFYAADGVELPFFRNAVGGPNVYNPNLIVYDISPFNADLLDIHPEDGWEMVQYDFGGKLLVDGILAKASEVNPYPHLIIYNRYNSKIRIYFLVPKIENFNGAYIQAAFPDLSPPNPRKTAIFAQAQNTPSCLIRFKPGAYLTSTNFYAPSARAFQWIYGEFDLAYDPCTCKIKSEDGGTANSKIQFNLCTQQLTKIDLEGESISQNINIANPSVSGVHNTGAQKTAFSDVFKEGQKHYKAWGEYTTFTNKALDQGYKLWSKKLEKEFFSEYSGGITDPATGNFIYDLTTLKTTDLYKNWLKADQNSNPTLNSLKTAKNVASVLPYVGVAIGLVDYLANGGKKTPQTVAAPSVSHTKTSFKLTGELDYTATRRVFLNTPGAKPHEFITIDGRNNNDDGARFKHGTYLKNTDFPMYNEPLGVFNVINDPKFEIAPMEKATRMVSLSGEVIPFLGWTNIKDDNSYVGPFQTEICEVRMKEIPKFVINPAAGMQLISIDAAIVLEYEKNAKGLDLHHTDYRDINFFDAIPYHPSFHDKNLSLEQRIEEIEKCGLELEYVSDRYPTEPGSVIRFRTKYTPLECLTAPSFVSIGWKNHPKVFVKYLVRLKRNFKGSSAELETNANQQEPGIINMVYTIDVTEAYQNAERYEGEDRGMLNLHQTPDLIYKLINGGNRPILPHNYDPSNGFHVLGAFRPMYIAITQTAFNNPYLPALGQGLVYNNEPSIFTSGEVTIPDNTVVQNGTTIIAGGKISIGNNVVFNNNVKLWSAKQVSFDGINISTQEDNIFEVIPNILTANCIGRNVNDYRATDPDIESACNSTEYRNSRLSKTDDAKETLPQREKDELNILVYPNPTDKNLTVNLNLENMEDNAGSLQIEVIDGMGKVVHLQNEKIIDTKSVFMIHTESLHEGIYILKLNFGSKTQQIRFVKLQ